MVGRSIKDQDNPISKLKSIFLQTACSKRDKGRPEVARSLLGEHLYSSTFTYKTYSLDYGNREVNLSNNNSSNQPATKKNLLDFFAHRFYNPALNTNDLNSVTSFIDFAKYFECPNGVLKRRKNPDNLIIITLPRVKHNENNCTIFANYCYYQLIKYSPWTAESFSSITKENSVELWKEFLISASDSLIETIR